MALGTYTFTAADGTTLGSYGLTGHGSYSGSAVITSNRARNATTGTGGSDEALYYASDTPLSAEYDVIGLLYPRSIPTSGGMSVCGRIDTAANTFYMARYFGTTGAWELYKAVAGTFTQLSSGVTESLTLDTNVWIKLEIRDAAKKLFTSPDGSTWTERITHADNTITAAGKMGFRCRVGSATVGVHLDFLEGVDVGGGGGGSDVFIGGLQSLESGIGAVTAAGLNGVLQ